MTFLLFGLGNPGIRYRGSRHNLGAMIVQALADAWQAPAWRVRRRERAENTGVHRAGLQLLLARPTTFMNDSGSAASALLHAFRLPTERLVVLHDDLDLPVGVVRASFNSRSAGHNGVQSIIDALGTKAFHRIRVGIGAARAAGVPAEQYVLARPTPEERALLQPAQILPRVLAALQPLLGTEATSVP